MSCLTRFDGGSFIPAYRLNIVDIAKGSLFIRFGLNWRGEPPSEERIEKLEQEIARMRVDLDGLKRADNDATLIQANETRKSRKIAAGALAVGVIGLIYTIVHDAVSEQQSFCGSVIADIMDHNNVSTLSIWSADCSAVIGKRDVPELERRERSREAIGDREHKFPESSAFLANGQRENPLLRKIDFGKDEDRTEPAGVPFPQSAHLPSSTDDLPENGVALRAGGRVGQRVGGTQEPEPNGSRIDRKGRIRFAGDAYYFESDDGGDRPVILIPPEGQALVDGDSYQVVGRLFSPAREFNILSAQVMQPLE